MNISQKFRMWLVLAKVGEEFVYHNGLLSRDRERPGAGEVERVAKDAMLASEQGLVELFQRRLPYTPTFWGRTRDGCLYFARRTGASIPLEAR